MKNCKYCGSELEDGQSVCPGCGREWTPEEAPVPEETLPTAEETVEEAAAPHAVSYTHQTLPTILRV